MDFKCEFSNSLIMLLVPTILRQTSISCFCAQNGAGDFIGGMKFCPTDYSRVYVASGEGKLTLQSFEGQPPTLLSKTSECDHNHHNLWLENNTLH